MLWDWCYLLGIDPGGELLGVGLGDQSLHGDFGMIGIAEPVGAVCKGELHGLDGEMGARDLPGLGEIEMLEDVQDLRDMRASRTGRRKSDDLVSAIGGAQRLALADAILCKVICSNDSSVRTHPLRGALRKLATVEPGDTFFRDGPIGIREIRLHEQVAGLQDRSIGAEEGTLLPSRLRERLCFYFKT